MGAYHRIYDESLHGERVKMIKERKVKITLIEYVTDYYIITLEDNNLWTLRITPEVTEALWDNERGQIDPKAK